MADDDVKGPHRVPAPEPLRPGERALLEADREELESRLRATRAAARRHTAWAVLGVSPGTLVPLLASFDTFGIAAVGALSVFVAGVEAWRAVQSRMDAAELEAQLERIVGAESAEPWNDHS